MDNKLDFFKGWKAGCYDVADILEKLAIGLPDELKEFSEIHIAMASHIRKRGDFVLSTEEEKYKRKNKGKLG